MTTARTAARPAGRRGAFGGRELGHRGRLDPGQPRDRVAAGGRDRRGAGTDVPRQHLPGHQHRAQPVFAAVAGPVLGLVLVPSIVSATLTRTASACHLHVRRMSSLLITAAAAAAALLMLAVTRPRLGPDARRPGAERGRAWLVAVVLLLLVGPQVVLYTVAALGASAQQARQRYALAAGASALENVGLMITMAVVALPFDPGWRRGQRADRPGAPPGRRGDPVGRSARRGPGRRRRPGGPVDPAGPRLAADPEIRRLAGRLRGSVVVTVLPAAAYFVLLAPSRPPCRAASSSSRWPTPSTRSPPPSGRAR